MIRTRPTRQWAGIPFVALLWLMGVVCFDAALPHSAYALGSHEAATADSRGDANSPSGADSASGATGSAAAGSTSGATGSAAAGSTDAGSAVPATDSAAPATDTSRSAAGGAEPLFVLVPKGVHPYYEPIYRGFHDAARALGIRAEIDAPPKFDVNLQVKVIEDVVARGVNGIAVSADDDKGLIGVVRDAERAGIPVITFDAPAPSTQARMYIGTDNERAGYEAGVRMAQVMGGHGSIAILQGGLDATNLNQRTAGFRRAVEATAPSIRVVAVVDEHGDFAESIIRTEELLDHFPGLTGIFSVSAEGAPSAATVIERRRLGGRIAVGGFDDLADTISGIRSGTIAFCVVQNTYKMGWLAAQELLAAFRGQPIPPVIDTGVVFVDRSNVDSYRQQLEGDFRQ